MITINVSRLLDRYSHLLIDAYGVLVTSKGAIEGAATLIEELNKRGYEYTIVTNDASRLPETAHAFYRKCGLDIPLERILTAGMGIEKAFTWHKLTEPSCAVLGTDDTRAYVTRAGGKVETISDDHKYDVVVFGDDSGFDFLPTMNALLTALNRHLQSGAKPLFLLANPDLLYPRGQGAYGFTSGSVARFLEMGLNHLHPHNPIHFEVLGKPAKLIFEMALAKAGRSASETVMLGDQLHTDILGANRMGISSALVATGVTQFPPRGDMNSDERPHYLLDSLAI